MFDLERNPLRSHGIASGDLNIDRRGQAGVECRAAQAARIEGEAHSGELPGKSSQEPSCISLRVVWYVLDSCTAKNVSMGPAFGV